MKQLASNTPSSVTLQPYGSDGVEEAPCGIFYAVEGKFLIKTIVRKCLTVSCLTDSCASVVVQGQICLSVTKFISDAVMCHSIKTKRVLSHTSKVFILAVLNESPTHMKSGS